MRTSSDTSGARTVMVNDKRGRRVVVTGAAGGWGVTPQKVVRAMVFLLSDGVSGVFGAHLPVDRARNGH